MAGGDVATLATAQGMSVADDQNTLRYGARGPALLEDAHFREKIFHFDHERIPERVVHARGYGAHGYFELTDSLKDVTRADVFQRVGERTPAFVRFSTVAGSKGSADLARDVRGFAVKLYTREGNWDLVGNNIPVFFIQDAIKLPDLIHSVKPAPDRGFPQAQSAHDNFWDFISLTPESLHMIMWVMSDRAIPRSLRFMEGFGVHTFRLLDAQDRSTFVKFHWKPKLGLQSVMWNEAVKINGADPDFHRRDLWDAINGGDFPEWELGVQLFDEAFAEKFAFDVLDPTKLIPEEELPVSDALSILKNPPPGFAGRKLGILLTDGADAALFNALVAAVDKEKAVYEVVAPKIGGVILSDGTKVAAKQKIDGGPSVLFDAVVILASKDGAALLAGDAAAKDFATDAFAHCKFIGYAAETMAVFEKAGLADDLDGGCIILAGKRDAGAFLTTCRALRFWEREAAVDLDAKT